MRPERCRPRRTATSVSYALVDVLLDAAEQEHLVVHGQAEREREDDDHDERVEPADPSACAAAPARKPCSKTAFSTPNVAPSEISVHRRSP